MGGGERERKSGGREIERRGRDRPLLVWLEVSYVHRLHKLTILEPTIN
jgi:hypothetical protein